MLFIEGKHGTRIVVSRPFTLLLWHIFGYNEELLNLRKDNYSYNEKYDNL